MMPATGLKKLPRDFYDRPTLIVARELLGMRLCFCSDGGMLSARIVETEAYIGEDDEACHAARGMTARNKVMFGAPGFAYVYFIYGMYHCLNFVTEREGYPAAVLIRAAEPCDGRALMLAPKVDRRTLSGPGKLTRAFGLDRKHNGLSLIDDRLFVADYDESPKSIGCSPRVGLSKGTEQEWRFFDLESDSVSQYREAKRITL